MEKNPETVQRAKAIRIVFWISIFANGLLAYMKIHGGWSGHSLALLGDGIDSLTDTIFALFGLFSTQLMLQPPNPLHPWGYGRIEAIGTKVLSMLIIFGGLQLLLKILNTLQESFSLEASQIPLPNKITLIISIISVASKLLLASYQNYIGKKINSTMVLANAKNMFNDSILSISVLLGIALTLWSQTPILEKFLSLLVALWICYSGLKIFFESSKELMDRNENTEQYHLVFDAIDSIELLSKPHRVRIRKVSNLYEIILDVLAPPYLRLDEAHILVEEAEKAIRQRIPEIFDIVVHLEPQDIDSTHSEDEGFGINPEALELFERKL